MATWDSVLFVCTGNICRSPMGEHLFRSLLVRAGGHSWPVASCGLYPVLDRATELTLRVMRERGLDLSAHRSQPLTAALLQGNPLVLTMERSHKRHDLLQGHPHAYTLHEFATAGQQVRDVEDPYGGSLAVYQACANEIAGLLPAVLARLSK